MTRLFSTKLVAALALLSIVAGAAWLSLSAAAEDSAQTVTSTFEVEGMTCGGCELGVKLKVKKLAGVASVDASYDEGRATVAYDASRVTPEDIIAAIEELGYSATLLVDAEEG